MCTGSKERTVTAEVLPQQCLRPAESSLQAGLLQRRFQLSSCSHLVAQRMRRLLTHCVGNITAGAMHLMTETDG